MRNVKPAVAAVAVFRSQGQLDLPVPMVNPVMTEALASLAVMAKMLSHHHRLT